MHSKAHSTMIQKITKCSKVHYSCVMISLTPLLWILECFVTFRNVMEWSVMHPRSYFNSRHIHVGQVRDSTLSTWQYHFVVDAISVQQYVTHQRKFTYDLTRNDTWNLLCFLHFLLEPKSLRINNFFTT